MESMAATRAGVGGMMGRPSDHPRSWISYRRMKCQQVDNENKNKNLCLFCDLFGKTDVGNGLSRCRDWNRTIRESCALLFVFQRL